WMGQQMMGAVLTQIGRAPPKRRTGRVAARPASHLKLTLAPESSKTGGKSSSSAAFTRFAFKTSRALDFFSESDLTAQMGHVKERWPLVLIKELIDNSVDACETAATKAIEVSVKLDDDSITVADNGPGIPDKVIRGVLDYTIRISDKKNYVAPTRGQL